MTYTMLVEVTDTSVGAHASLHSPLRAGMPVLVPVCRSVVNEDRALTCANTI